VSFQVLNAKLVINLIPLFHSQAQIMTYASLRMSARSSLHHYLEAKQRKLAFLLKIADLDIMETSHLISAKPAQKAIIFPWITKIALPQKPCAEMETASLMDPNAFPAF